MWTSTLEHNSARVIPTKLLGLFWPGAYFSSFAPLQVQNLPRQPLPAANWVRVRNSLAGICGRDLQFIFVDGDLNTASSVLPSHSQFYPGHEVVGEVIEVGEDVKVLHVGDRVVLEHSPNCVTAGVQPLCRSCAAGNYALCESGDLPDPHPIGGGWSEEMLLHEQQLFRISPDMSDAQAVMLEPSAVAVHAVLRKLPQANERVLIIGAGTTGLLILQAIRALSPDTEVHVLARHAFQVERAASMGAKIIYPRHTYQQVQLATGAHLYEGFAGNKMLLGGYDCIFDTIGSRQTTHDALRWARAGSTVVMVGLSLHQMRIDLTPIWYQEINLIGSLGHGLEIWPIGSSQQKSTFEIAAELIEKQQMKPDELITQRYLLTEYRAALMDARHKAQNRAIKIVFDFTRQPPSVVPNVRAASRRRQRLSEPRPSQPLVPPAEVEDTPVIPEPRPLEPVSSQRASAIWSAPEPVASSTTADEDAKTVVVSRPKRTRYGSPLHLTAPQNPDIDDDEDRTRAVSTSQQDQFNVTPQYGSLPGFHQGLEKFGIAPPPGDEEETTKNAAVPPITPVQAEPAISPAEDQGEAPLIESAPIDIFDSPAEAERDYAWMQFITPSHIDTGDVEEPPPFLARLTPSEKMEATPIEASHNSPVDEIETPSEAIAETPSQAADATDEKQSPSSSHYVNNDSPTFSTTPVDEDATRTVVVPPSKRSRSRRKTDDMQAPRRKDAQALPLVSANTTDSPKQVTNKPPEALQDVEDSIPNQEQASSSAQVQEEN